MWSKFNLGYSPYLKIEQNVKKIASMVDVISMLLSTVVGRHMYTTIAYGSQY